VEDDGDDVESDDDYDTLYLSQLPPKEAEPEGDEKPKKKKRADKLRWPSL
jgi:hypothetical protein